MSKCLLRNTVLFSVLLVLIAGCGYRFAGTGGNRLASGQTVWVAFIGNETVSPTAQTVIRRALLDQLHVMRGIAPAASSSESHLVVTGTLRQYENKVIAYTAADRAGENRLTITVECELKRNGEPQSLWKGTLKAFQDYPALTDLALQRNAEEAALVATAQKVAEKFITSVEQAY